MAAFVGITFVSMVPGSLSFLEDIDTWASSRVGCGILAGGTTISGFINGFLLRDDIGISIAGSLGGPE